MFASMGPSRAGRSPGFPALNLYEVGDAYLVTVELPGIALENLDLTLASETLSIRGERWRGDQVAEAGYRRRERPFGAWAKSLSLPSRVREEAVTAHYADGILAIRLPKVEPARPRQIAVTTPS